MNFTAANGSKPSTQARRYVYRVLAETLEGDLANGSEWMFDEMDEPDQRRVRNAVKKVIVEMRRKAAAPPGGEGETR